MQRLKGFLLGTGLLLVVIAGIAGWLAMPWAGALGVAVLLALWMSFTRRGRQARSVAAVGLTTLPQRLGSSLVIVIGIAGVVGVLVALLAMAQGYRATLRKSGSTDTAIVLRGGSANEVSSVLGNDEINVIGDLPGVARDADGEPLISPEIVVAANLPLRDGGPDDLGSVQLRGVGPQAFAVRPNVELIDGRRFEPGLRELIAGTGARRQFAGLDVGNEIKLGSETWTVVGIFESGDSMQSEVWADAATVASAYRRGSSRTSVLARLTGVDAFDTFKAAVDGDARLSADTMTTLEYFEKQSSQMTTILRVVGMVVGAIMAIGAVFGALNCMFAAVAARAREIATLRAIGFRGLPVVIAVMLETMLLALAGGVIGGVIAWALFNGFTASTIAGGTGQLTFEFEVNPALLWTGIKWALAIGFVGGLYPAVRAATLPVTAALRES
ncbi:MAG TPA: ABC transporter permease [Woeseiaceae bacterium]